MKPSLPQHYITTLHRTPGGLRALDILIKRITLYSDQKPGQELNILVFGDEQANFCIPIAALGYGVTNLHISETSAKKAQELADELGVTINSKTTRLQEELPGHYDIIIDTSYISPAELIDTAHAMLEKIKSHGLILLCSSKKNASYKESLKEIRSADLRIFYSAAKSGLLSGLFSKFSSRIKKGSSLFHLLDKADSILAQHLPNKVSASWIFECRKKNSPKLVAYVLPTLSAGGGAERLVMQLAARMPDSDYEAHIITNVCGGGLEEPLRQQNIPFTILERKGVFGRFLNISLLKNLLKDLDPDIVHTNLFAADFWGRISARLAGCKNIITTIHNVQNDYGKLGIFTMRLLKPLSKKYIAISTDVLHYLKSTLHISPSKINTIHNGIEISKIIKRQNRPFYDVPRLLFIGRLEPQKNPDIFLRALAEVRGRFECSIYGEGSMEHELKLLADELGILPRIYWQGVVCNTHDVYAKHDIFILPSAYEGFGLVAVEAAVAGIPMVVSDLPVMRELFKEKIKMVKPGGVEDLARAIEDILDRPAEAINQAQHISTQDYSEYSIDKMATEYAKLYDSLLTSSTRDKRVT